MLVLPLNGLNICSKNERNQKYTSRYLFNFLEMETQSLIIVQFFQDFNAWFETVGIIYTYSIKYKKKILFYTLNDFRVTNLQPRKHQNFLERNELTMIVMIIIIIVITFSWFCCLFTVSDIEFMNKSIKCFLSFVVKSSHLQSRNCST